MQTCRTEIRFLVITNTVVQLKFQLSLDCLTGVTDIIKL